MNGIKKKSILYSLLIIAADVIIISLLAGVPGLADKNAEVSLLRQGVLDLADRDPAQEGMINLCGEWEFLE